MITPWWSEGLAALKLSCYYQWVAALVLLPSSGGLTPVPYMPRAVWGPGIIEGNP